MDLEPVLLLLLLNAYIDRLAYKFHVLCDHMRDRKLHGIYVPVSVPDCHDDPMELFIKPG